jgi:hypothetical protein
VKPFRFWLLLLLAVLLPLRGAMAAAMLCPPGGPQPMQALEHAMAGAHADAAAAGHEHHGPHHGPHHAAAPDTADGEEASGGEDRCDLCAAFCSAVPLLRSFRSTVPAQPAAAVAFPALAVPAPSFVSDGQERPPRSI